MIARLNGLVAAVEANSVVIDVNGVGYRASVPLSVLTSLPGIGAKITLHTVMTVREDDISLYGFSSTDERTVFLMITGVTGVGPKVGLSMLSVYDAAELARAISTNDVKSLTKIPGVGPKLAQRVAYELGEQMAEHAFAQRLEALSAAHTPSENAAFEDAIDALVNLGYSRPESRKAVERASHAAGDKTDAPNLIRQALNLLTKSS